MQKKGSLNLSIQAIVIVVIAFVVLGLGLSFVRGQFKSMEETASSVQAQIKQQILDDLRTGNKKLSFPTNELKMETSSSKVIAIGIKNTGDNLLTFKIQLDDLSSTCAGKAATIAGKAAAIKAGTKSTSFCAAFFWDAGSQSLKAGDSNVYSIKYFAPQRKGSYLYKIKIVDSTNKEYASRNFFVTTI